MNPLAAEVAPVQRSNPFFTAENLLSVAALSLMALLPVSDMVARATGINGITGGAVIVQQLTLWIGFLGAALAARSGNLLSLSASTFLPDKLRAPARIVAFGVLAAVALCLAWASLQFVQVEKQSGSWLLQDVLPKWVALVIMPVGFAAIALRAVWLASPKWSGRALSGIGLLLPVALYYAGTPAPTSLFSLGVLVMILATLLGLPIFAVFGGFALLLFWNAGTPIASVPVEMYRLVASPLLPSIPLFTFAGIGFIYNPMQLGLTGVYQPRFDAGRWMRAVEEMRPMMCFLVPSMAQLIVAHPSFATADLSSIQLCAIGSAPLPPATLVAMQTRMPEASVSNSYGMTEAGPAYCAMPKGESLNRIGSVGQPMPPLEVRFLDEAGNDVARGEVGEVVIRLEGRQREYYRDPDATAGTWKGGWLHSGDLGRMDEDGYLYIVGRKKDVIIRGGNNIYASDVESALHDHPDVVDAAVVGMPHQVLGEDVAAFVVLVEGSPAPPEHLRSFVAERLADYKVPRRIDLVDELPRNATGKVLKAALRARFASA